MLIITVSNCLSIFALRLFLLMNLHVPEDSVRTYCSESSALTNDRGKPHFTTKLTIASEAASWVTFFVLQNWGRVFCVVFGIFWESSWRAFFDFSSSVVSAGCFRFKCNKKFEVAFFDPGKDGLLAWQRQHFAFILPSELSSVTRNNFPFKIKGVFQVFFCCQFRQILLFLLLHWLMSQLLKATFRLDAKLRTIFFVTALNFLFQYWHQ